MQLSTVTRHLSHYLKHDIVTESSRNGLQVRASSKVIKIGGAVDATRETIMKAKKQGCDLLVVHHGILWRGKKGPGDVDKKRVSLAKRLKVSVFVSHLPLDRHPVIGNAAVILQHLRVDKQKGFGVYNKQFCGRMGSFRKPVRRSIIADRVNRGLGTRGNILAYGKEKVRSIGVLTGSGASALNEAVRKNIDMLITGELLYATYNFAKEASINVIAAGHYHTEKTGIRALLSYCREQFNLPCVFISGVAPQ